MKDGDRFACLSLETEIEANQMCRGDQSERSVGASESEMDVIHGERQRIRLIRLICLKGKSAVYTKQPLPKKTQNKTEV